MAYEDDYSNQDDYNDTLETYMKEAQEDMHSNAQVNFFFS